MPVDYTREFDPTALLQALGYEADFDSPAKARARAAALRGDPGNYGQESAAGMGGMMLRGPTAKRVSDALYTSGERGKKSYADQVDAETQTGREARKTALSQTMQNMKDKRAAEAQAADDARQERQWQADYALRAAGERRQAAQSGQDAWAAIADPISGEIKIYNKKTGEWKDAQGNATDAPMQSGPNVGPRADGTGLQRPQSALPGATGMLPPREQMMGKPPAEAQGKSGMRGGVTTQAMQTVEDVVGRNPSAQRPGIIETAGTLFGLPSETQQLVAQAAGGADRGLVRGAQEGAIDAALTEMTGAAYTEPQLATYRARFMPTILDNAESTAAKKQQFMEFIREQSTAAGRAWTPDREARLQELAKQIEANAGQGAPGVAQGRPGDRYLRGG